MDYNFDGKWAENIRSLIINKVGAVARRSGDRIPYLAENGTWDDMFREKPFWWCNGFWSGIQWLVYLETQDEFHRALAEKLEKRMDAALYGLEGLHHDVGFMWLLNSVANYRITKNKASKTRGLIAANYLASRYNPQAGFITAWNSKEKEGWSIIDTMMNLPLLYWAGEETGYDRYRQMACLHADKTMRHAVRPDGSVAHIIEYDIESGDAVQTFAGQGYAVGSSWTRGQAWALYGFALSYRYTQDPTYLATAKRIANYFLASVAAHNYIPPIDFRSPKEPVWIDTTAGAIAASGLIDLSRAVDETESGMYWEGAQKLLTALEKSHADWDEGQDAILHMGSEAYHAPAKRHVDIIYGDYYFIEAIMKLCGTEPNMW